MKRRKTNSTTECSSHCISSAHLTIYLAEEPKITSLRDSCRSLGDICKNRDGQVYRKDNKARKTKKLVAGLVSKLL